MPIPPKGAASALAFPALATAVRSPRPSEIECEVIRLFDQHRNALLRYAVSLGLSMHDGEEIIQEVFLALFWHLRMGRSRRNLRGWVFCVAHNLALKRRHANRRSQEEMEVEGALAESRWDPSPNPEEQVLSAQRQQRFLAVLNALPQQDRSCLRLRAAGLRYREIARALGISLGSVSASLTRSLARLTCVDGS